jgi:hypothetical protein
LTKLEATRLLEKMTLPVHLKILAAGALAMMDDTKIESIFGKAQQSLDALRAGDRGGAETILVEAGLPPEMVKMILDKVVTNAGAHLDG